MSFSKAKLKRFNDIDVACVSPATGLKTAGNSSEPNITMNGSGTTSASTSGTQPERREQIEKFFKDAVRFATNSKETKEFAVPKDVTSSTNKDDKKSKGYRLFRTPSLPHRLRFRQNSDVSGNGNGGSSTVNSTPTHSATTTPIKETPKSAGKTLKGKEALQLELRKKNELIDSYMSQIDVLKRHVEQLKETEIKLREDYANIATKTDNMIYALQTEVSEQKALNDKLMGDCAKLEVELGSLTAQHTKKVDSLRILSEELKATNVLLEQSLKIEIRNREACENRFDDLQTEIIQLRSQIAAETDKAQQNFELIENLKNTNDALMVDATALKHQIEQDALSYAQEIKIIQNEMECLKNERNTLKNDLASKCELIRSLQDERLDMNCEIDAHCDTIRQLCREKAKFTEKEKIIETAEERIHNAELQAAQTIQKLESDMENAIEREKAYWRSELEKRQKLAENEVIKVELEKQDVMVLLESTNDMLRDRDEKIQKYEDQLRNGIDYYVQLTDALQKQVVALKQDIAKTISEKYNYQLTLNNTRSTVNILMDRLKKSDADVEQLKSELESTQLAKGTIEQSYLTLQSELETLRVQKAEAETALESLRLSSQALQQEVLLKQTMYHEFLNSEQDTLDKFNKIASSFQERADVEAARYLDLYNELKCKDEAREMLIHDMKRALDEFSTVLQLAQLELDNKERTLANVREESEQLKLENITLKSKIDESAATVAAVSKKENITDLEKIEDLLIDSELRAECDKITSWLLSTSATAKSVCNESSNEICDLLKPTTPNTAGSKSRNCTTPVRASGGVQRATTPRTPKTLTPTPRTTPKKAILFQGKENLPSPQKQVLKARNM